MSILLSAYFPEGIVFVADRNVTFIPDDEGRERTYVEPSITKVLTWPRQRAVVGFIGLAKLAGLAMDEWLRLFIAETRDCDDIDVLAYKLRQAVQDDYERDFQQEGSGKLPVLVLHLGGFSGKTGTKAPVMYHILNHSGVDEKTGKYGKATRTFQISEEFESSFKQWWPGSDYPEAARERLADLAARKKYAWYNNGARVAAFNVFKGFVWESLHTVEEAGFGRGLTGISARLAFCKMAVEVFGAYFTHHFLPDERAVGGGVDAVHIDWPT